MTNHKNNIYPCCALCHQIPSGGLHDGLRIMGRFICSDCERTLVALPCDDERYGHFVQLLKTAFHPFESTIQRYTSV